MTTTLLSADDVQVTFGGVRALDGLTLNITDEHHLWGLIGPNGSGKSTFFNLVTGLCRASRGSVGGTALRRRGRRVVALGRTFQSPRVFGRMTVAENLLAVSGGMSHREARERADELLTLLRLTGVVDRRAGELSIGQQKLVELARALLRRPELVLLDEMAAGVHPDLRGEIAGHLRRLADQGSRFVVIEHDMALLLGLCTRVFCLAQGRLLAEGTPDEMRRNERVVAEYLGAGHA